MRGKQMRLLRLASGMTQSDLAARAGVTRLTVIRYEAAFRLPDTPESRMVQNALKDATPHEYDADGTLVVRIPEH